MLKDFQAKFEEIVLATLKIKIHYSDYAHLGNTDDLIPIKVGFSFLTFVMRNLVRQVLMALFLGFIGGFILSGVVWTRKGQAKDVTKKVLKELNKPVYREKIVDSFATILGNKRHDL